MLSKIEQVFSIGLAVGENLTIKKHHLEGDVPGKRFSLVSGIHGDEMEGQYVCYELIRRIQMHPEWLTGTVDVYPALNPLGLEMASRTAPKSDMDMNRIFPGSPEGNLMEKAAAAIVDELIGSDLCIDLHASDKYVREIPQVRVSKEFADKLLPYAKLTNVDIIWMNANVTVHESTLAHSMNMFGVPTMVIEMGEGMRINRQLGDQVVEGLFNLLSELGIWQGPVEAIQMPAISTDGEVEFIRAGKKGVFLPVVEHNHYIREGESIGQIVDVLSGEVTEEIVSPHSGLVFTLREYPFVYEGGLLARVLWQK